MSDERTTIGGDSDQDEKRLPIQARWEPGRRTPAWNNLWQRILSDVLTASPSKLEHTEAHHEEHAADVNPTDLDGTESTRGGRAHL